MPELQNLMLAGGGLGLFLMGMVIMTDSLKKLAGDKIRAALLRFTHTPTTGAMTGAISTAIVQSSSATTLAAIGFVGAGLMTFSNSLGIIFGANIGTTITGWMVALLGFKLSIGSIASIIILSGVFLRLFANSGKLKNSGLAIAGFGLLFIGIDTMQTAMAGLVDYVDFSKLPANNLLGILQLVLIGLIFTTITQSSSAGVALTLTALFSGIIEFEQAVALVIGMDIGTTVKSLLAVIGGSVGAKRTGLSHVVYNLMTAALALLLIVPYVQAWEWFQPGALYENAEIALVGFHTLFNLLGVILILPFTRYFAQLIIKLFPQKNAYIDTLDKQLLQTPELALNAVQKSLNGLTKALINELNLITSDHIANRKTDLQQLQQNLDETQYYLDEIHLNQKDGHLWQRLVEMIHIVDHLQRLHERCEEESYRAEASKQFSTLKDTANKMSKDIEVYRRLTLEENWQETVALAQELKKFIDQDAEAFRHQMVEHMGQGTINADQCRDALEAIRWMQRVSHHLARLSHHLQQMQIRSGSSA
ncbi:Na/Pi cotransporter family protein [Thiomicrorhabdus indica]|uniref:Na/Pi cotransporter family protein n=1 Tax=Thiomicrorhabdus indica TaxID=2267253 RepID=UPI00102D978C|nr:Na/Pi symporter [Thiomicrorhabdus indica]